MSKKILISAEPGSDVTNELAERWNIVLIPMYVSMGGETLDDGKLLAVKKYRGKLEKQAPILLREFDAKHNLQREHVYFIASPYMEDSVRTALDAVAAAMGFERVSWFRTGCVITCHAGPGAFGIVGSTGKYDC